MRSLPAFVFEAKRIERKMLGGCGSSATFEIEKPGRR